MRKRTRSSHLLFRARRCCAFVNVVIDDNGVDSIAVAESNTVDPIAVAESNTVSNTLSFSKSNSVSRKVLEQHEFVVQHVS